MSSGNLLDDQSKSAQHLAAEVAELKGVLQDIMQQVRRIERRVDLALPGGAKAKKRRMAAVSDGGASHAPVLSSAQARETINRMTKELREGKSIQAELREMTVKHGLKSIARELGITSAPLPPKTELVGRIITRLRQSVMLTENIGKTPRVAEEKTHFGD